MIGEHQKIANHHLRKYKRALCFGAFDPLHFGHIRLFRFASNIAEEVYAVTEDDKIIEKEKGRKIYSVVDERVEDIKAIRYIKDVGVRDDSKDRQYWVDRFQPDILVVGDDHDGTWKAGEKLGIPIVYKPYTKEISSTYLRTL